MYKSFYEDSSMRKAYQMMLNSKYMKHERVYQKMGISKENFRSLIKKEVFENHLTINKIAKKYHVDSKSI
jgi:hypothetical protein